MSDKIKCPSCGREIKATAKHCGFCGAKIEEKPIEKTIEPIGENSGAYVNPLEGVPNTRGARGGTVPTTVVENIEINSKPENVNETPVGKMCTVCGKKMTARAKFCGACGGMLVDDISGLNRDKTGNVSDGESTAIERKTETTPKTLGIHPDFKPAGEL